MAMKKIESEKDREKKKQRNQTIAVVFMASLLLLSTAGYFAAELFGNNQNQILGEKIKYGGLTYYDQGGFYALDLEGAIFYFFDLPNSSRDIYQNTSTFDDFYGKPLYITEENSASSHFLFNLDGIYSRYQKACYEEECEEDIPPKNCSDNLIVFRESEEDRVERVDNCLFIYGNSEKGIDAITYNMLGIK